MTDQNAFEVEFVSADNAKNTINVNELKENDDAIYNYFAHSSVGLMVVVGGEILGVVSYGDLLRSYLNGKCSVEYINPNYLYISSLEVDDAIRIFQEKKIFEIPVIVDGVYRGLYIKKCDSYVRRQKQLREQLKNSDMM